MSKYTTEVRFICESLVGKTKSVGSNGIESVIEKAVPQIFDFGFPIFKEEYRNVLATKILKHYYTREIGYETYGLWKFKLGVRLNEIMPYYNQLYESTLLEFNPLYDVDYTRTHEREKNTEENGTSSRNSNTVNKSNSENSGSVGKTGKVDGETTTSYEGTSQTERSGNSSTNTDTNTSSSNWDLYSDTPQGTVANLNDEIYLTNARKKTNTENSVVDSTSNEASTDNISASDSGTTKTVNNETVSETSENTSTSEIDVTSNDENISTNKVKDIDSFLETVRGKMGGTDYSEKLIKYRQTFLNIDMLVIEALSDLFMNLW